MEDFIYTSLSEIHQVLVFLYIKTTQSYDFFAPRAENR